jgi:hypothetical protein
LAAFNGKMAIDIGNHCFIAATNYPNVGKSQGCFGFSMTHCTCKAVLGLGACAHEQRKK